MDKFAHFFFGDGITLVLGALGAIACVLAVNVFLSIRSLKRKVEHTQSEIIKTQHEMKEVFEKFADEQKALRKKSYEDREVRLKLVRSQNSNRSISSYDANTQRNQNIHDPSEAM